MRKKTRRIYGTLVRWISIWLSFSRTSIPTLLLKPLVFTSLSLASCFGGVVFAGMTTLACLIHFTCSVFTLSIIFPGVAPIGLIRFVPLTNHDRSRHSYSYYILVSRFLGVSSRDDLAGQRSTRRTIQTSTQFSLFNTILLRRFVTRDSWYHRLSASHSNFKLSRVYNFFHFVYSRLLCLYCETDVQVNCNRAF